MDIKVQGVIPSIVTPFKDDFELDISGLKRLTDFLLENKVHGLMTTGDNGEFPHLLPEERMKVLQVVLDRVKGLTMVIACVSTCSTSEAIVYARHAKDVGANCVILTAPYYYKLPLDSIYEHFKLLAEAVDIPVVVYNNPEYTGHSMSPQLVAKLAELPGVVALKQSSSDLNQTSEITRIVGDRISILTGIDKQLYQTLSVGGKGVFSTAACIYPAKMVELFEAYRKGDTVRAHHLHLELQHVNSFFEYGSSRVAACKEALRMMGLPSGPVRKPLPSLNEEERGRLAEALRSIGVSVKKV